MVVVALQGARSGRVVAALVLVVCAGLNWPELGAKLHYSGPLLQNLANPCSGRMLCLYFLFLFFLFQLQGKRMNLGTK